LNPVRILTYDDLQRTFMRLAHQLVEPYDQIDYVVLIGLQPRGVHIAREINRYIEAFYGKPLALGVLDITFHRDDFRTREKFPEAHITDIPFDLSNTSVILIDDVLFTGRTLRAAMDALMDFGRPSQIFSCCLIDRGHRELPIVADYVGKVIATHPNEGIRVKLDPDDAEKGVFLIQKDR